MAEWRKEHRHKTLEEQRGATLVMSSEFVSRPLGTRAAFFDGFFKTYAAMSDVITTFSLLRSIPPLLMTALLYESE